MDSTCKRISDGKKIRKKNVGFIDARTTSGFGEYPPHYVYKNSNLFKHEIPIGKDNINKYLNDLGENCSENRNLDMEESDDALENYRSSKWRELIKPHLEKMCDILPLDKVKGVFGPYTYTEFLFGDDIKIGIFGEYHDPSKKTHTKSYDGVLPMHSFIKSLLLTNILVPRKKYDFYMETKFINKKESQKKYIFERNFTLHLLDREFERCFQLDKSLCEYNNLRAHYMDVRDILYTEKDLYYSTVENFKDDRFCGGAQPDRFSGAEGEFNISDEYYLGELVKIPIIQKQLNYNKYSNEIKEFILLELINLRVLKPNVSTLEFAQNYIVQKKSLSMDIYTIGRLTKNVSILNQKNIIIYAGNSHADVYARFLLFIKAKLQHYVSSSPFNRPGETLYTGDPIIYFDDKEKMPLLFEGITSTNIFKKFISTVGNAYKYGKQKIETLFSNIFKYKINNENYIPR